MSRARLLAGLHSQAVGSVLRSVCTPLSLPSIGSPATRTLANRLVQTMQRKGGVGLAAPQCSVPVRMFVAELDDAYDHDEDDDDGVEKRGSNHRSRLHLKPRPSIIINPVIHSFSSSTLSGLEGCLSLPGLVGSLSRSRSIRVSYLSLDGVLVTKDLTGFRSRLFQHEVDHLDGILFVDRIEQDKVWTDEAWEKTRG